MKSAFLTLLITSTCFADSVANLALAESEMRRGELINAEQTLNAAIDDAQSRLGHNSPVLDGGLDLLAQVYQREKRYSDAVTVEQWRLDIWAGIAGENGVIVGRVLYQLSGAQRLAGNLADAESSSRRALAIMTAAYVDKPPAAQAAVDLADILIAENRSDEAGQMLALAEKTYETALGPASFLASGITARRASILKLQARPAEASVYRVGGTGPNQVMQPRILSKVEPQYSEEARKNKLQGSISMSMVIDATGTPTQIAILRPLGMGLDEEAITAVSKWKFSPGTKNGTPVPVYTQIEITLRLF
jgi:TonB family protein